MAKRRLSCIYRAVCKTWSGLINCVAHAIGLGYGTAAGDLEGKREEQLEETMDRIILKSQRTGGLNCLGYAIQDVRHVVAE